MDGTPIFDIKPYIAADMHADATFGFTTSNSDYRLQVEISDDLLAQIPQQLRAGLIGALAEDPRPAYHDDPNRLYGMSFAGLNVKFRVHDGVLTVCQLELPD